MTGVQFVFGDDTVVLHEHASIVPEIVLFDKKPFRSPLSALWNFAGSEQRTPDAFRISIEVWDEKSVPRARGAAARAREITEQAKRVVYVDSYVGRFRSAGLLFSGTTPIEDGLLLTLVIGANPGRVDLGPRLRGVARGRGFGNATLVSVPSSGAPEGAVTFDGEVVMFDGEPVTFGEGP